MYRCERTRGKPFPTRGQILPMGGLNGGMGGRVPQGWENTPSGLYNSRFPMALERAHGHAVVAQLVEQLIRNQ
jgi:hypothetical protein